MQYYERITIALEVNCVHETVPYILFTAKGKILRNTWKNNKKFNIYNVSRLILCLRIGSQNITWFLVTFHLNFVLNYLRDLPLNFVAKFNSMYFKSLSIKAFIVLHPDHSLIR